MGFEFNLRISKNKQKVRHAKSDHTTESTLLSTLVASTLVDNDAMSNFDLPAIYQHG